MDIPNLLPGQEFLAQQTSQGKEKFVYAYRSQDGTFFSCTGNSETEVRDKCMSWLISMERHRNIH